MFSSLKGKKCAIWLEREFFSGFMKCGGVVDCHVCIFDDTYFTFQIRGGYCSYMGWLLGPRHVIPRGFEFDRLEENGVGDRVSGCVIGQGNGNQK